MARRVYLVRVRDGVGARVKVKVKVKGQGRARVRVRARVSRAPRAPPLGTEWYGERMSARERSA